MNIFELLALLACLGVLWFAVLVLWLAAHEPEQPGDEVAGWVDGDK